MYRIPLSLTVVILLGLVVAACTGAPADGDAAGAPGAAPAAGAPAPVAAEPIKVGIPQKTFGYLGFFVALNKGFFAAEGLAPEYIVMNGDLQPPALIAGEIDFAGSSGTIGRAAVQGVPVKLVLFLYERPTWSLVSRPDVASAAQLRGRTVGVTRVGTSNYHGMRLALERLGLNPDTDVNIIGVGPQTLQSLLSGAIDAAVLNVDLAANAKKEGYHDLNYLADLAVWPFGGFGVSDRKLAQQREQVKRYVRAQVKAIQYMLDNQPEVVQLAIDEFELSPEAAPAAVAAAYRSISRTNIAGTDNEGATRFIDFELKEGLGADVEVRQAQFLDLSVLEEVHRELGIRR
jgi:NitT/TauT family transport system substrate-binding protein